MVLYRAMNTKRKLFGIKGFGSLMENVLECAVDGSIQNLFEKGSIWHPKESFCRYNRATEEQQKNPILEPFTAHSPSV